MRKVTILAVLAGLLSVAPVRATGLCGSGAAFGGAFAPSFQSSFTSFGLAPSFGFSSLNAYPTNAALLPSFSSFGSVSPLLGVNAFAPTVVINRSLLGNRFVGVRNRGLVQRGALFGARRVGKVRR